MAGFVPNDGYKCSKNQSGRRDLNPRPLDPQARIWSLASLKESDGEPLTCSNALAESQEVRGSRNALAPLIGSRLPWRESS